MNIAVQDFLRKRGYEINSNAYSIINECDDWYRARQTNAHDRITVNGERYTLYRMGFGARAASDDANLCEVVDINAGAGAQYDFINGVLAANRFDTQFRKQVEMVSAEGTAACYVRLVNADVYDDGTLHGGEIRLDYVDASGFVPITVVNDQVTEAAFWGKDVRGGKEYTTVVLCTRNAAGRYTYTVRVFDDHDHELPQYAQDVTLGEVKPFAVLHTAQVNTIDDMAGFGLPKLYGVIPVLRGLDAAFTALMGDIDGAEKITLINEALCDFDGNGMPLKANHEMKRRFVFLGDKLPEQKDVIHEITPEIRVQEFRDTIELLLNILSQQFGYGTRRYSFDRSTGALMTATQYIGERQDMMQELNRQRYQAKEYITDIVHAIMWFANTYQGRSWDTSADVLVEFDDSYVMDRATELAEMRNDIAMGVGGAYVRQQYLMQKYNLDEAEARKWAMGDDVDAAQEPED